ncbi:MAG: HupE/UreJ family protein [Chloroflexota bacterium]
MFILAITAGFLFHTGVQGGALTGFLHPLLGLDHLLAMIAVGILSTQMGGRAIWTVPAAFVLVMLVGGILGLAGIELPIVEYGITGSVLALGIAILLQGNMPVAVAMFFVGIFGLFHGHAHGTELPESAAAQGLGYVASYVSGFLIATVGLHLIGALVGLMAEGKNQGNLIMRLSGAAIAIIGVALIVQV